jgi:hypothetical protein
VASPQGRIIGWAVSRKQAQKLLNWVRGTLNALKLVVVYDSLRIRNFSRAPFFD